MDGEFTQRINLLARDNCNVTVIMFIKLHKLSGARISDLLRVGRGDITNDLYVRIRQSKGSMPLIVKLYEDFEFWNNYKKGMYIDISCFNSNYFYRLYRRYGFTFNNGSNKNVSVTHSFRKELAREMYIATGDIASSQSALGHKSSRSTEYYLNGLLSNQAESKSILNPVSGQIGNLILSRRKNHTIIRLIK